MEKISRGIRNNNPLNIRHNARNKWFGLSGCDSDGFCMFSEFYFGALAALKLLSNYVKRGFNTPAKIIGRWAPSSENNTSAYVDFVCRTIDRQKDYPIDCLYDLIHLAAAMCLYECGEESLRAYYDDPVSLYDAVYEEFLLAYLALTKVI